MKKLELEEAMLATNAGSHTECPHCSSQSSDGIIRDIFPGLVISYFSCDCGFVKLFYGPYGFQRMPFCKGVVYLRKDLRTVRWLEDEESQKIIESRAIGWPG